MSRLAHVLRLGVAYSPLTAGPQAVLSLPAHKDRTHSTLATDQEVAPNPAALKLQKSFQLHIGANLPLPTRPARPESDPRSPMAAQPLERPAARRDYFEGLPLRAWAERLGERAMPTVELVQEEHKRAQAAARKRKPSTAEVQVPSVPHFLPFTSWAARSKSMRNTLVADEPSTRQRARLSWYHPDDTMVPRDWFKAGLLADLQYYRPFGNGA